MNAGRRQAVLRYGNSLLWTFVVLTVAFAAATLYLYLKRPEISTDTWVWDSIAACANGLKTESGASLASELKKHGIEFTAGSTQAVGGAIFESKSLGSDKKLELYKLYVECVYKTAPVNRPK